MGAACTQMVSPARIIKITGQAVIGMTNKQAYFFFKDYNCLTCFIKETG